MTTAFRLPIAALTLFAAGCYTQLATVDRMGVGTRGGAVADSGAAPPETVTVKEREVCYWERDLLGRPRLRCYESYYEDEWQFFHDYPWWYRDYTHYYDYDCHCPYHVRYHPTCRYCWYYCDRYARRECSTCDTPRTPDQTGTPSPGGPTGTTPQGTGPARGGASRSVSSEGPRKFAGPRPGSNSASTATPLRKESGEPAAVADSTTGSGQPEPDTEGKPDEAAPPDTSRPEPPPVRPPRRIRGRRR